MDENKINEYRQGVDAYIDDVASRKLEEIKDNITEIARRTHYNPGYFLSWDKEELCIISACLADLAASYLQMVILENGLCSTISQADAEVEVRKSAREFRKLACLFVAYVEMFDDERHGVS